MGKASYSVKLLGELVQFARERKAYWIVPLVMFLVFVGALIATGQAGAPLLYTLF